MLCGYTTHAFAQNSAKEAKQQADIFFENKKYQQALQYYLTYLDYKQDDEQAFLNAAICLYESNHVDQAQTFLLNNIQDSKKVNPQSYLYLAKTYHANLDFKEAVKNYKKFLATAKETNLERRTIRDAIRRCGNGLKVKHQEKLALVENLGDKVNASTNDFAPVVSPNYPNKLYFASARPSSVGGLRNAEGKRDNTYGEYSSDMYFTSIYNGEWTATTSMSALLNTPRNDMILDFSADGSVLFYYKGYNLYSGEIFVDTFSNEKERLYPPKFDSDMIPENGDGRPDFFKDSIVIFDSRRAGGFGGSDLYYMVKTKNGWSSAKNMGKFINSQYDETTPFVAADGHTLYFSSNDSRKSIGGMDVFTSTYNQEKGEWSKPQNLGFPINSAKDDSYFSLSVDGLQGYFSSNRKESLGEHDIFVAYFKEKQNVQNPAVEEPYSFVEKIVLSDAVATNEKGNSNTKPIKSYDIEPLYYTDDEDVLSNQNTNRLNALIKLMQENPQTQALLSCHSDESSQFGIYFAIKRAEQAANYIIQNGIDGSRISMRGLGAYYPIAQNTLNNQPNEMGRKLNRRIDIEVLNNTDSSIKVNIKEPQVSQFMTDSRGTYYKNLIKGLTYKVQIGALKQMYKGELLKSYGDPLVERVASMPLYQYSIGMFQSYSAAQQLKNKLIRKGNSEVFVVAYVQGRRISKGDALNYTNIYPDLRNFIEQ